MIIPIIRKKLDIGDKIILLKTLEREYFIAYPGHEFEIIGKDDYGFIIKDPETGLIINKISSTYVKGLFTLKVDLNTAESEYILEIETEEYLKFIKKNCPNKSYDFDHYDEYDSCELLSGCGNGCRPKLECAKHIEKRKIKECKVLVKHLRSTKLKNIDKL